MAKEMSEELSFKLMEAMHRVEQLYYETNGKCYLSFSGGKDSTVILAIIKLCEEICTIPKNAIPAVYCDTRIELNATKEFVEWVRDNWYGNVEIIYPEKPFYSVIKEYGKPMKSKMKSEYLNRWQRPNASPEAKEYSFRQLMAVDDTIDNPSQYYKTTKIANKDLHLMHPDFDIRISSKCCDILKKKPFEVYSKTHDVAGYFLGERMDEGGARYITAKRRLAEGGKLCTKTKGSRIVKMPIIDWTDENIAEFIEYYNVPLSRAYTEYGLERTGCYLCPFSLQLKQNLEILKIHEPTSYRASMAFLKDVYIAQDIELPFDEQYEKERLETWENKYHKMRFEMLDKYRQGTSLHKRYTRGLVKFNNGDTNE